MISNLVCFVARLFSLIIGFCFLLSQNKELAEPATAALTENSDEHDFTESDLNR